MRALLTFLLLLAAGMAGCLSGDDGDGGDGSDDDGGGYPYADGDYVMEGEWSVPLQESVYGALPGEKVWVPVRDGTEISLGLFWPDMEGCDWDAADLPEECRLPVVMSASPYNLDQVGQPSGRPPLPEWLVPRGFAIVQMSLRGTGESGGCMDFKDPRDAQDISDIVDWIADQPWSDGNVGVAGRSYVGTSAWAAAASGNPHVKTIMPISGAVDGPALYFRNGTHESRVLTPHLATYWALYAMGIGAVDPTYRAADYPFAVCPEVADSQVYGPMAAFTGDASSDYWQSRILTDEILADYDGSAWVIHGMVDWNVDPSQVVPFVNDMIDAGIPTRAWLGQWAHAYPDNTVEHWNTRWDWSTQVVDWFTYYLKGEGPEPILGVEVEDDTYRWRHEDHYPPRDTQWVDLGLGGGTLTHAGDVTYDLTAPQDMQVAGLVRIELDVTPLGPGGQVGFQLYDDTLEKRIAWGVMDLRHADGGNTDPDTVVPGNPITLRMQSEPADSVIQEGDTLRLVLTRNGVQDINPDTLVAPIVVEGGVLRLPTVERTEFIPIPLPEGDERRSDGADS